MFETRNPRAHFEVARDRPLPKFSGPSHPIALNPTSANQAQRTIPTTSSFHCRTDPRSHKSLSPERRGLHLSTPSRCPPLFDRTWSVTGFPIWTRVCRSCVPSLPTPRELGQSEIRNPRSEIRIDRLFEFRIFSDFGPRISGFRAAHDFTSSPGKSSCIFLEGIEQS